MRPANVLCMCKQWWHVRGHGVLSEKMRFEHICEPSHTSPCPPHPQHTHSTLWRFWWPQYDERVEERVGGTCTPHNSATAHSVIETFKFFQKSSDASILSTACVTPRHRAFSPTPFVFVYSSLATGVIPYTSAPRGCFWSCRWSTW